MVMSKHSQNVSNIRENTVFVNSDMKHEAGHVYFINI